MQRKKENTLKLNLLKKMRARIGKRMGKKNPKFNKGISFNRYPENFHSQQNKTITRIVRVNVYPCNVNTTDQSGLIIANLLVNPQSLIPNTEMGVLANFYERWKANHRLRYRPAASNTLSGDFIMTHEPDASDKSAQNGQSVDINALQDNPNSTVVQYQGAQELSGNATKWVIHKGDLLWTSPNSGQIATNIYSGRYLVACKTPSNTAGAIVSGTFEMELKMTLSGKFNDNIGTYCNVEYKSLNATTAFPAVGGISINGNLQNFVTVTPSSNVITISLPGRYQMISWQAVTAIGDTPSIVATSGATILPVLQNYDNTNNYYIVNSLFSVSSPSGVGAVFTFTGYNHCSTTTYSKLWIFPMASGNVPDTLVAPERLTRRNADQISDLYARIELLTLKLDSKKEEPIIEISNECKHKRALYDPLGSYRSLREKLGESTVDMMDDTSIQYLLKNFNQAPKLSQ